MREGTPAGRVSLLTVAVEWTRIGVTGFGGPPAHVALLRRLVVDRRGWISERELQDAIAACNLLPGPASTQLAIFCARRVAGPAGALIGGLCFIVPGVGLILLLSALFLAHAPPAWIRGAGAGSGAAVAAVAVRAAFGLMAPSWSRAATPGRRRRWLTYIALGAGAAALAGPYLVLALLTCGLAELGLSVQANRRVHAQAGPLLALLPNAVTIGSLGALAWVAFKVGALSYGGGFVIVPLMQGDAVHVYHWMTSTQFLNAVALGQVTPGPVLATVAAVGYAAHGLVGGLIAAAVTFTPSFAFVLGGGVYFDRLRTNPRAQAFLDGAGPAAVGAILGAAIPLAGAVRATWQIAILVAAALALLAARRGVLTTLIGAGVAGAVVALVGGPVPA